MKATLLILLFTMTICSGSSIVGTWVAEDFSGYGSILSTLSPNADREHLYDIRKLRNGKFIITDKLMIDGKKHKGLLGKSGFIKRDVIFTISKQTPDLMLMKYDAPEENFFKIKIHTDDSISLLLDDFLDTEIILHRAVEQGVGSNGKKSRDTRKVNRRTGRR